MTPEGSAEDLRAKVSGLEAAVAASPKDPALRARLAEASEALATQRRRDAATGPAAGGAIHLMVEVLGLRRRAVEGWAEAVRLDRRNATFHTGRARALGRLAGSLMAARSDPDEVLAVQREAVDTYAAAFRLAAPNADDHTRRGALLSAIGVAEQRGGDPEAALGRYREALGELRSAQRLAPTQAAPVSESGWVLVRMGNALADAGRPGEAIASLESAIAAFAEVRRLAPQNSFGPLSQGQAYTILGDLRATHRAASRPAGGRGADPLDRALGSYRQGIACYDSALGLEPDSIVITSAKAEALQAMGELHGLAGRPAEALAPYQQALALYDGPLAGSSQSFQHQLGRGRSLMRIGELHRDLGDESAASANLEAARAELSRDVPIGEAALPTRVGLLQRVEQDLTGEDEEPEPESRPN